MRSALVLVMTIVLAACGTTPRITDALSAWRSGRRAAAIRAAHDEVERFRTGNHISNEELDTALAEIDDLSRSPIVLPDENPPAVARDPGEPDDGIHGALRSDLTSTGATRTLRALRAVERLALARFDTELFVIIWRRDPYTADGPLLREASKALRSIAVKRVALRALEALP